MSRKNITNGEIVLNQIDPSDKVDGEIEVAEYDDTLTNFLEMEPESTKTFLENLKSGDFLEVSEKLIQRKLQTIKQEEIESTQSENLLKELNKLIHEIIRLLDRFIFFFQGLLGGLSMMHLVVIYLDDNKSAVLKSYSRVGLKIDQVFHILAFISCFGSLFIAIQIKQQSDKTQRASDKRFFLQSIFSCIFYTSAYILIIINHRFVALISNVLPALIDEAAYQLEYTNYSSQFDTWAILYIVITMLALLGWYISVTTTESNLDFMVQAESIDNNITSDTNGELVKP